MKKKVDEVTPDSLGEEVLAGLTAFPKYLPSKYFYDEEGDRLFQEIMAMESYYPTDCEFEILNEQVGELMKEIPQSEDVQLIELGAGDGSKTETLLASLLYQGYSFQYFPNDISPHVLDELTLNLLGKYPFMKVQPLVGDYFSILQGLDGYGKGKRVILFLGGNIGNFRKEKTGEFLDQLGQELDRGDRVIIGFDLKKDPKLIQKAYNDPEGITARFNLNLLERINRELGGEFDTNTFFHHPIYDPQLGEARSYLVSKVEQEVPIKAIDTEINFQAWEAIFTERSKKFDLPEIHQLATEKGFEVVKDHFDQKGYFVDSVWERR